MMGPPGVGADADDGPPSIAAVPGTIRSVAFEAQEYCMALQVTPFLSVLSRP